MKKMEELMELFLEETDGFKRSVNDLREIKEEINRTTIEVDTSKIETLLKSELKEQAVLVSVL